MILFYGYNGAYGGTLPLELLSLSDRGLEILLDSELTKEEIKCDIKGEEECSPEMMSRMSLDKNERSLHWSECRKNDNMACEAKLKQALVEAIRTCATLQTEALDCCHAPEECVGGSLAHALDSLGKMNVAIGTMKGGKAHCDAIQQTHGMYGGMQGVMTSQCQTKAGACTRDCSQKMAPVNQAFEEACGVSINSGTSHKDSYSCDEEFFNHYIGMYKGKNEKEINIAQVPEECKRTGREANRRIQDMGTNLGASLLASAQECEVMAQENGWGTWSGTTGGDYQPGPTVHTTTASTTGASESVGGSTGSNTGGYATTDGSTMGVSSTDGGGADPTNPLVNPDTPGDVAQIPGLNLGGGGDKKKNTGMPLGDMNIQHAANPFDTEPAMEEAGSVLGGDVNAQDLTGGLIGGTGGGSSGGGGLGGTGGGGSGGGGRYGAYGSRKPAQVALGLKSGGKFKGYGGGGGNKGGSSKGSRARKKGKKNPKNFASLDLKKLLPKGKQINHKTGKYGSPHDNIFKRMSDRIQWMCRKERIDCR